MNSEAMFSHWHLLMHPSVSIPEKKNYFYQSSVDAVSHLGDLSRLWVDKDGWRNADRESRESVLSSHLDEDDDGDDDDNEIKLIIKFHTLFMCFLWSLES